ncbi:MAG: hypothetical protein ACTHLJ_05780 [Angustibacter sp.]
MSKKNVFKVAGFIGTLGAGAALVATAATGTGAWFTDSADGGFTATAGHLRLSTGETTLHYSDLWPGTNQTKDISYSVDASGPTDVWFVLDDSTAQNAAKVGAFTGASGDSAYPNGGLGAYGHFEIWNNSSRKFVSSNLARGPQSQSCVTDANGNGGSTAAPHNASERVAYCGVPTAVKVADNLTSGQGGTLKLVFGLTGKASGQNIQWADVPFKVVATQHGVRPGQASF